MNIQHLKYAVEVEKTGSISQAADSLFMNQPNLSKAIRELEASLGCKLFQRTSKGVKTTVKGREILAYAKRILAEIEEMNAVCAREEPASQRFSISVPRSSYVSSAFADFVNALDPALETDIRFRETNSVRAVRNILEDGFRLGIIRFHVSHEPYFMSYLRDNALTHRELWAFPYRVLLSTAHPLADGGELQREQLDNCIELTHGDLHVPYLHAGGAADTGKRVRRRIYVYDRGSQFDLLTRVPGTYMWVAPMPSDVLRRNELALLPCADEDNLYKDVLVYAKNRELDVLEELFLEKLAGTRERVQAELEKK